MVKASKIWMDGKFVDWADANVHLMTHTLHYGLGVFEGIRCYECVDGRSAIFRLPEHTKRLFASAHIRQIKIPFTEDEINGATAETVRINGLKQGYIRPLVYLGAGSMGLYPKDNPGRVAMGGVPRRGRTYQRHKGQDLLLCKEPRQQRHDEGQDSRQLRKLHTRQ